MQPTYPVNQFQRGNFNSNQRVVGSSLTFGQSQSYPAAVASSRQFSTSSSNVFPNFILNPRAVSNTEQASSVSNSNRVARTVPNGSRFINNVPIRQYQWPDYVTDENDEDKIL